MKALVFIVFILLSSVFAQNENFYSANDLTSKEDETLQTQELPKVLYLNFEKTPKRVLKGEIFPVTIKTLSTIKNIDDINYSFSDSQGLTLLNEVPYRKKDGRYYHDTFYFLTTSTNVKLPTFNASIVNHLNATYSPTELIGEKLNVIALNPQNNFSKIIANSFELLEYKTTNFDNVNNIVIFVAKAQNCYISALHLNNVYKQGIESVEDSIFESKITYYAIISKEVEHLSFSYFNLVKNKFELVNIPIVVDDDSVTTQTDLKPIDQSREMLKASIAAIVSLLIFFYILYKRNYWYLLILIIPLIYIGYLLIPSKEVCIKSGTNIHLLPVKNGTIFETTPQITTFQIEGKIKDYTKVKLQNDKVGWVHDEDICSY